MSRRLSQASPPPISLRVALKASPAELLHKLKLYNDSHEEPTEQDIEDFTGDDATVNNLIAALESATRTTESEVLVQPLQVLVTLASVSACMEKAVASGVLEALHRLFSVWSAASDQSDPFFNFMFAMQTFCESSVAKPRVGPLLLTDFCAAIHEARHPTNIRRTLMGCVNALIQGCPDNKALVEKNAASLEPFATTLRDCGDHYLQHQIVEFLFRMRKTWEAKEAEFFGGNEAVIAAFTQIKASGTFAEEVRRFLDAFNLAQGPAQKVFSFKALEVHVGPEYHLGETWVDFGDRQVTFNMPGEGDAGAVPCDLDYRLIRHLKISTRAKHRELRFKMQTTPTTLQEMYDTGRDDWIVFAFEDKDLNVFSSRVGPIVIKVQKSARKTHNPAPQVKPSSRPKSTVSPPIAVPDNDPVEVTSEDDGDRGRRVTRSSQQGKAPSPKPAAPPPRPKPAPLARDPPLNDAGNPSKKRPILDAFDVFEPGPAAKIPQTTPRAKRTPGRPKPAAVSEDAPLSPQPPRRPVASSSRRDPPAVPSSSSKAASGGKAASLHFDDAKLDFPGLLSQGALDDGENDDDGDDAISALQRQLETLVTKHKEADRKKGTAKINETMATVQRRLDAFKADAARRRTEAQSEAGDRLARLQEEVAETKKGVNQLVTRFQADIKETHSALNAVAEQVTQLAHEYETELPQRLKADEDRALQALKAEVEGEVHRLDQQLQNASKSTKTIKLIGQLLSKALSD